MEGTPPPPPELPPPVPVPHAVPEEYSDDLPPDPIVPPDMDVPPEDPQPCYPDHNHGYPEMHHQGYSDPHQQDMHPVHTDMHPVHTDLHHEQGDAHPIGVEEPHGDMHPELHIPPDSEVPPPAPDANDLSGAEMNAVEGEGATQAALAATGDMTELNSTQGPVVVTETEQVDGGEKAELEEGRSDNCCDKLFRCLSHVPCASLAAWILLLLGLGGLCGSLLIAAQKTRALLGQEDMLWFLEFTLTGVVVAMFVLGTLFLVAAYLSSEPSSRRVFNSTGKNQCARGLNIFLLVFVYILTVCWLLVCLLLAVPIILVGLPYVTNNDCLNLHDFGFQEKKMCGNELKLFKTEAQDLLICYGVGYLSALFIIISMIHFMISISANITHLRDSRFATLNAYAETEELRNSKHSVIDTNM